jgi:hypothetical protein
MTWRFRIPQRLASTAQFAPEVTASAPDALGLVTVDCALMEGITRLV